MKTVLFVSVLCGLFLFVTGCTGGEATRSGIPPLDKSVQVLRNISYVDGELEEQMLDIYIPETNENLPLIIFIHGGGWKRGDKKHCKIASVLTRRKYVVASINYRLSTTAKFPAQIHDVKAAVRFLKAHANEYKIDKSKVGVWGVSAGGHLAALLGTSYKVKALEKGFTGNKDESSEVHAVADCFGPTDPAAVIPIKRTYCNLYFDFGDLLGNKDLEDYSERRIRMMNPITYIDPTDPPFLVMHGLADEIVPESQSRALVRGLRQNGVKVIFKTYPGEGHSLTKWVHIKEVLKFFRKTLKNPQ